MRRPFAGFLPLFLFCSAYAQNAQDPPLPTAPNIIGIAIFLILFVGACVGFFVYALRDDKSKKHDDTLKT